MARKNESGLSSSRSMAGSLIHVLTESILVPIRQEILREIDDLGIPREPSGLGSFHQRLQIPSAVNHSLNPNRVFSDAEENHIVSHRRQPRIRGNLRSQPV